MVKEFLFTLAMVSNPIVIDVTSFSKTELHAFKSAEVSCLADNVYHEARSQGIAGQIAVINVTINRVNDSRYPNTICDVVKDGPTRASWKGTGEMIPIRNRCQFSWWCDGKSDAVTNQDVYRKIYALTYDIVYDNMKLIDITEGATHYHADYVQPAWAKTKTKTIEIEDHIFYRWEN